MEKKSEKRQAVEVRTSVSKPNEVPVKKVAKLAEEKRVAKEKEKNAVTLREKEKKKVINEVKKVVALKENEKEKEKEVKKEVLVWKESTKSELFLKKARESQLLMRVKKEEAKATETKVEVKEERRSIVPSDMKSVLKKYRQSCVCLSYRNAL